MATNLPWPASDFLKTEVRSKILASALARNADKVSDAFFTIATASPTDVLDMISRTKGTKCVKLKRTNHRTGSASLAAKWALLEVEDVISFLAFDELAANLGKKHIAHRVHGHTVLTLTGDAVVVSPPLWIRYTMRGGAKGCARSSLRVWFSIALLPDRLPDIAMFNWPPGFKWNADEWDSIPRYHTAILQHLEYKHGQHIAGMPIGGPDLKAAAARIMGIMAEAQGQIPALDPDAEDTHLDIESASLDGSSSSDSEEEETIHAKQADASTQTTLAANPPTAAKACSEASTQASVFSWTVGTQWVEPRPTALQLMQLPSFRTQGTQTSIDKLGLIRLEQVAELAVSIANAEGVAGGNSVASTVNESTRKKWLEALELHKADLAASSRRSKHLDEAEDISFADPKARKEYIDYMAACRKISESRHAALTIRPAIKRKIDTGKATWESLGLGFPKLSKSAASIRDALSKAADQEEADE